MTKERCTHATLVRAKTGGWYCISQTGCEFSIPEPVEPTCNCFAPRVCPVHGQRYVWPESGEASFAHKPGCAILTAAGNPACSCGALKSSTEPKRQVTQEEYDRFWGGDANG
jgi:hypothetical protein